MTNVMLFCFKIDVISFVNSFHLCVNVLLKMNPIAKNVEELYMVDTISRLCRKATNERQYLLVIYLVI